VLWATLIFAVHPIGTHSVAWISGRKDAMSAAFAVAALLAVHQMRAAPAAAGKSNRTWAWFSVAMLATLLAIGSKESALILALLASVLFLRRPEPDATTVPRRSHPEFVALGTMWCVTVAVIAWRVVGLGNLGLHASYASDRFYLNVATSAKLLWHYVGRILIPSRFSLSDTWYVAERIGPIEGLAIVGVIGFVALLIYGSYRNWPANPALVWFAIWIAPLSGVLPLRHFRAERYSYPASWGLLLGVLILLLTGLRTVKRAWSRRAIHLSLATAVCWLCFVTARGNLLWHSDAVLFADAVSRAPHYVEGRLALAGLSLEQKDYESAVEHSRHAIADAADPRRISYWSPFVAHTNLGLALYYQQRPYEAIREFQLALGYRPNNATAQYHVGLAAFAIGDLRTAKEHLERSLELKPNDFLAASNLAVAYLHLGDARRCAAILRPLVVSRPDDLLNRKNLGAALIVLGRFAEAQTHFVVVVDRDTGDSISRAKLAWCQWLTGDKASARDNLTRAQQLAPDEPTVRFVEQLFEAPDSTVRNP
jgi:Flp pilus assembly protein TadD